MAFNKELLQQNMKPLLAGLALGILLGAGAAGYAVYLSQAPGRKAMEDIAKVTAEVAACATSLKEAADGVASNKALREKSEAEKAQVQKQLTEAISEIDTLTANLKKIQIKPQEKKPTPQTTSVRPSPPTYSRRPAKPADSEETPRENWEEGL